MSVRSTNTVVIQNIHVILVAEDLNFCEIQMPVGTRTCISEYVIHRANQ